MKSISEYHPECKDLIADVIDIFDRAYFWETITLEAQLEMAH